MSQPRQLLDADHLPAPELSAAERPPQAGRLRLELPAERASVGAARRFVAPYLDAWSVPGPVQDDAVLLVSELVTNVLLHTASTRAVCEVTLSEDGQLRIEVHDDHEARLASPRAPADCAESGRGLLIVQRLAHAWGAAPSAVTRGNVVWATLAAR